MAAGVTSNTHLPGLPMCSAFFETEARIAALLWFPQRNRGVERTLWSMRRAWHSLVVPEPQKELTSVLLHFSRRHTVG